MKKIFEATVCLSLEEIRQYSKGKVSDELRYKIENHLIDCPLCADAMDGYQTTEEEDEIVFDDLFAKIDVRTISSHPPNSRTLVKRRISWNRLAAGLLFLLTAGAAYLFYQSGPAGNNYQAYFQNEENNFTMRSIDESGMNQELAKGLKLYQNDNFQASLSFFEDYLKSNPESSVAAFYAGKSSLRIGELERAYNFLLTVRVNDDKLYEEATWALVNVHLNRGEINHAKEMLQELIDMENSFYSDRAKELLKELE